MALVGFWAVSIFLWLAALPLAARLFPRLPGAGAGLAFPLGTLVAALVYFLLRVADVLEQGRAGYVCAAALLLLLAAWSLGRHPGCRRVRRSARRHVIVAVSVFTFAFFAFAFYRAYLPDIAGTEQPMDLLYLNATMTSPGYPPEDPWLAGEAASYYYLGYLQVGLLTGLAGIEPATGYNLGLAWVFGATAASAVTLGLGLARAALPRPRGRWPGTAAAAGLVLLLAAGSVAGVFELAAAHEWYSEGIYEAAGVEQLLPCAPGEDADCYRGPSPRTRAWYPTEFWFWFRDTRLIPDTIVEFPVFSFLLGDLHPHLMALPLVMVAIACAFEAWRSRRARDWAAIRRDPGTTLLVAAVMGALAFQNAWDLPTFGLLFTLAVAGRAWLTAGWAGLRRVAGYLGPIAGVGAALYLPWFVTFSSQAGGLSAYMGEGTRPAHALLQFGPLLAASLGTLALGCGSPPGGRALGAVAAVLAGIAVAWLALAADSFRTAVETRGEGWFTLAAYATAVVLLGGWALAGARRRPGAAPALALASLGVLLFVGTELFFVRDVFADSVPRLNTVFKLSYQAWVVLALAGGMGIAAALRGAFRGRAGKQDAAVGDREPAEASGRAHRAAAIGFQAAIAVPALVLVAAALVYPVIAAANRAGGFPAPVILAPGDGEGIFGTRSLDGLAGLERDDPGERALIRWVSERLPRGETLVEATGRTYAKGTSGPVVTAANVDYTDAGRVAARTGRPVPVGWYFHEVQWRGDGVRSELDRRQELVDRVYTAGSATVAMEALASLGARYVVVGRVELQRYPGDLMPPWEEFLEIVFEQGNVRVYAVPHLEAVPTS